MRFMKFLTDSGKIYTCLKIDEVNNLGAARIRVRSLLGSHSCKGCTEKEARAFSHLLSRRYRLPRRCAKITPSSARRCHRCTSNFLEAAFNASGYHLEVLPNDNKHAVDVGLKYVNNDACYPSLIVVGQIMDALLSGKYDLNKTASHHVPDRRWMPCIQLYRIYPPCT